MTAERTGATEFTADVLVIGGGPAGTWAALTAAGNGASVILADKGFCGSSGATAPSGTSVWYVDPDPETRRQSMNQRESLGGYLAHHDWMRRVLDRTYDGVNELADWGYPFPQEGGQQQRISLQGPEYMRLMRKRVKQSGCLILDHSPALELLRDEAGRIAGARGLHRQKAGNWTVRAKAVVIASGGCAFLSKALGCNVLTGDGLLMAAEAGADLSGMEFSNAYAISTAFGSVTKTAFYSWASFYDRDGSIIPGAGSERGRSVIARTLQKQPVFACIDRATPDEQADMRFAQPNFFLPFDRAGIDPFTQHFPITLRLEGTVRGTGGLRIIDESCATAAPGLYAAGDAATRELICGGFTGGGSHNAAWAMSSGAWAGAGAADYARQSAARQTGAVTGAGRQPTHHGVTARFDPAALITAVQAEVLPTEKNYFRNGPALEESLQRLNALWQETRGNDFIGTADPLKAREAVAMLATARWMYHSALGRTESRGMHKRSDYPQEDLRQHHHLTVGGLDDLWLAARPTPTKHPAVQVAA
jgi:succinate dehydrogenase/fumarate reductase flavoprotein subunit